MRKILFRILAILGLSALLAAAAPQAPPAPRAAAPQSSAARKPRLSRRAQPAKLLRERPGRGPASWLEEAVAGLPPLLQLLVLPLPAALPSPFAIDYPAPVAQLLDHAYALIGTPYRRGGQSPQSGFDCSGFVRYVFHSAWALSLPSSSVEQFRLGEPVAKKDLQPGDLVFFRPRRHGWHVGIYAGDGLFIHSPRHNRTVSVTSLSSAYFRRCYVGARRILPSLPEPVWAAID